VLDSRFMSEPHHAPAELRRSSDGLGRRAMLQSLVGTVGAGFAFPFIAEGHPMQHHLSDQEKVATADANAAKRDFTPEFLDAHQLETLELLAERIVPGSTRTRVAPFLDSLLAVSDQDSQRRFLRSLGAFERLALDRQQRAWKSLTAAQQDELLTRASTASHGPAPDSLTVRDHFDDLRGWISGAYYSSEIGMRELGWTGQVTFDSFAGCDHPAGHQ
jgi:hypothetical protein